MYRVLTDRHVVTFKTDTGVYEIQVHNKIDGKAHVKVVEITPPYDEVEVPNRYGQVKTITEKDVGYYTIIEDFYPALLESEGE